MLIQSLDLYTGWYQLLCQLLHNGSGANPRDLATREILGVTFRVDDSRYNILDHPGRNLNLKFMVAEWLWIMSGSDDLEEIAQYNSEIRKFSDDDERLAGAYGPRIDTQLEWLLTKLAESNTRQAVISIWTPTPTPSKDIPCTVALQFLRRDDKINLLVTMRSSDVWLGLPYDFFVFSQILGCVSGFLACEPGFIQFNLGSSHLYEKDVEAATAVAAQFYDGRATVSPRLPDLPPSGLYEAFRLGRTTELNFKFESPWDMYAEVLKNHRSAANAILGC